MACLWVCRLGMSLFRSLICLCSTEGSTDCLETKGGLRNDRYKLLRRLKGCVRRIRSKAIRPTLYYLRYSSLPAPFPALAVPVTRSATSESSGIFLHLSVSLSFRRASNLRLRMAQHPASHTFHIRIRHNYLSHVDQPNFYSIMPPY